MNLKRMAILLLCACGPLALRAGDLAPEQTAKILKGIASGAGEFQVTCKDPALKAALSALGLSVEDGSSIVWCTSLPEAKGQQHLGRLVVVGRRELSTAACVIIEEDGGRPKIILNTANLRTCKVKLGDALMKIGEKF